MTLPRCHPSFRRGATLIEAVIAIGVLAVAIPLVFGALAEGGRSGLSAQAETRSAWIIPACMDEIQAAREGRSQYFTPSPAGLALPLAGEALVLAFSPDGKPIGKLSRAHYEKGTRELDGKPVRYIASMTSTAAAAKPGTMAMLNVRISLEYPATAKASKRNKLDFHTRMP